MKTAVSVPDAVFQLAEQAAKRLQVSRSELYSRALSEYLARHTDNEVTSAIDAAIAEVGQPRDEAISSHARRLLRETEW
jgi:metal-responsive CopG/Arc/MetJ family transcriptional regulator